MAVINSVLTGSGRNKVGEVTLSVVRGQTVARKYQPNVANPRTPSQIAQRNRLTNMLLLYKPLKGFIIRSFEYKPTVRSNYNEFASRNTMIMPDVIHTLPELITLPDMSLVMFSDGGLDTPIHIENNTDQSVNVGFRLTQPGENSQLQYGDIVTVVGFNNTGATTIVGTAVVQANQVGAESIEVQLSQALEGNAHLWAYWQRQGRTMSSPSHFEVVAAP